MYVTPELSLHWKGPADHPRSFGSNNIQRMFIFLTFESSARGHLVTKALGETSSLNTAKLVLHLDGSQDLTLRAEGQDQLTPKGFSESHVLVVPHLTYLSGWVNYYMKYLPQRLIIKRDSTGQRPREAAFMSTLRRKFPVGLNAGEFTFRCKNNTYCYISSLYLLSSAEITAVCTASSDWRRSGWQNFLVGNHL